MRIGKKYFTTSDCNKFTSNILDAKIHKKSLLMNLNWMKRKKHQQQKQN